MDGSISSMDGSISSMDACNRSVIKGSCNIGIPLVESFLTPFLVASPADSNDEISKPKRITPQNLGNFLASIQNRSSLYRHLVRPQSENYYRDIPSVAAHFINTNRKIPQPSDR